MGYRTHVTGELNITPPLVWSEIRDTPFNASSLDSYDGLMEVKLRIQEVRVETDEGSLIRKTASTLIGAFEEGYKAYHLVDHVQMAVDAFPGHTWTGRFDCEGEENGDLWRVVIRDGRAVKVTPRIVWPDGEPT